MMVMQVGRFIQSLQGRGNDLYQTLRYESVRASAGTIHLCTVEGVQRALSEAAGQDISLPGGSDVPFN
jgi:hypothetical protein